MFQNKIGVAEQSTDKNYGWLIEPFDNCPIKSNRNKTNQRTSQLKSLELIFAFYSKLDKSES